MRRSVPCLFVCLPLALAAPQSWAQQAPELNEIVITATRIESPILDSPSAITVITPADIAASGAHDLSGVIEGHTGAVVADYGPQGATKSVSLRGSTSAQVLVLVDGVRLNSSRDGMVDFSLVPFENVDHVEIVRGGASTMYGSGAIGGVINIITKKPQGPAISLSVTNTSYIPHDANTVSSSLALTPSSANAMDLLDGQNVELSLAGKLGGIGLTAGGAFARAANGYTWFDPTAGIDTWRRMSNADSLSGSAYAGVTAPMLGGEVALKSAVDLSNTGSPGSLKFVSTTARQTDASATGSLSWKTERFLLEALTCDLKASYRHDQLTYNDPAYPPESVHTTNSVGLDVTQKFTASDAIAAVYGGSAYYDAVESTNYSSPQQRLNLAGFLSVPVSPTDRLTITPSARYDYFADFSGSLSGSLSAVLLLSETSSLRVSAASAYRVPTLNDLYWYDPFGYTAANPNLKPETSYSGEVGFSTEAAGFSMDASVFTRYVSDNIVWLASPPLYVYTPENLTTTLFPGAELHAKLAITKELSLEASYTFDYSLLLNDGTTALTLSDNRRVPYAPVHTVGLKARYAGKVHSGGVELRYLSDQYTDSANTASQMLQGCFVMDADYRFEATEHMALTLAAKNIFNALYYTQLYYPMPPFSLEAGMKLHL